MRQITVSGRFEDACSREGFCPALASEIGQAFPDQTQHVRSGVMKRLRSAGLVDYQTVVVKGVTTRRWRAI